MSHRLRTLLLLVLTLTLTLVGVAGVTAAPKPKGLICGTPDDPIPCSTFDNPSAGCYYTYQASSNCCVAALFGCLNHCC